MSEQKGSQKSRRNTQGTALEEEKLEDIQGGASGGTPEFGERIENVKHSLQNNPVIKNIPVSPGQEEPMAPPGR
ncbi:hypothetical protein [Noviherbaspirillum pedocola]|uniref:Uncharacterized protein n=1 Tax=Noviherbaspirillum pedocola TaxID=2801341 RepID=A0A934SQT2_9BURK|nr:hypothetical protein [Noviherbaspirillum pedocola]MBK4734880.1 hypothetical protein [Noviherbaspirillum pedocola]